MVRSHLFFCPLSFTLNTSILLFLLRTAIESCNSIVGRGPGNWGGFESHPIPAAFGRRDLGNGEEPGQVRNQNKYPCSHLMFKSNRHAFMSI